ncbi:MAG TPA: type II secretion system F family protein [Candidatus Norongarragalinales archaeon]|nr:type II secretion system F family protein [Candidatus Norongarragalinales archaeon]
MFESLLKEKKREQIEERLPGALLQCAGCTPGAGVEEMWITISKEKSPLGEACARALGAVRLGASVPEALELFKKECDSQLASRVAELWLESHRAGSDFGPAFRDCAEAFFELQELEKERRNAGAMQKYTMIAAVVLVPLIMGIVLNVVSSLQSGLEESIFGTAPSMEVFDNVKNGATAYVAAFSLIVSIFLSFQKASKARIYLYAAVLLPLCLSVFFAAQGFALF